MPTVFPLPGLTDADRLTVAGAVRLDPFAGDVIVTDCAIDCAAAPVNSTSTR
jgi:hypothetical protein